MKGRRRLSLGLKARLTNKAVVARPAARTSAALYPITSGAPPAAGCAVAPLATAMRAATPTAEPMWREELISPLASPCSRDEVGGCEGRPPKQAQVPERIALAQLPDRKRDEHEDGERRSTGEPDRMPTVGARRDGYVRNHRRGQRHEHGTDHVGDFLPAPAS